MSDEARPASFDDLKALLPALPRAGADYVLVGASGLAAHRYRRAMTDVDLVVPTSALERAIAERRQRKGHS